MSTQLSSRPAEAHSNEDNEPEARESAPEQHASPSDPAMLRKLYSTMLKCRIVAEHLREQLRTGRPDGASLIQPSNEATVVGSLVELRAGDAVATAPSFATYIALGQKTEDLLAQVLGRVNGSRLAHPKPQKSPVHFLPASENVAARFSMAAGFALAQKAQQRRNVVVASASDGFAALGCWHEAALTASGERLPIVFVLENNVRENNVLESNLAEAPLTDCIPSHDGELRDRAGAYGIPGITVDGDDVVAVWRVTQESIHRARSGAGPTLIECRSSRRPVSTNERHDRDPLAHMERYLKKRRLWDPAWQREIAAQFTSEVSAAIRSAGKPVRGG